MNIHDKFNSTNFDKTFSLLNKFDSFKIVDGNITFFKKVDHINDRFFTPIEKSKTI